MHVNPGKHVPHREMRGLVREWARASPLEMESKGDRTFEFLMPSEESVERLLTYNYQEVENSEQVLLVKKMPVQFSVVEIFDVLKEHMAEQEYLEMAFPRGGARARGWLVRVNH